MDKKALTVLMVISFLFSTYGSVFAGSKDCYEAGSAVWKDTESVLPSEIKINKICNSPVKGVYEVSLNNRNIIYFDPLSKTVIFGVLVQSGVDLTKKRRVELFGDPALPKENKGNPAHSDSKLKEDVVPSKGVILPVVWGDLGKRMVEAGVIDGKKIEAVYSGKGGLNKEEKGILYGRDNKKMVINLKNSRFILNMFWALGIGNKNDILEKGPMMKRGFSGAGRFASTGGWTISNGRPMDHYSKHKFLELNKEQQALVERVSKNIYRPCCNNSTYFPDCNHGMAMLGLLELLASQDIGEEEMYKVALRVNSYWFPDTYLTIARLFKEQGVDWDNVKPGDALSARYSSGSGFKSVLAKVKPPRFQGGRSCGVN